MAYGDGHRFEPKWKFYPKEIMVEGFWTWLIIKIHDWVGCIPLRTIGAIDASVAATIS